MRLSVYVPMITSTTTPPISRLWPSLLAFLGLLISLVALYEHIIYSSGLATGPSFCNLSQHINCEAVNASEWSTFLGVPIAAYGVFFYTAILVALVFTVVSQRVSKRAVVAVIFLGSSVASITSLILFGISEFLIGALCLLCIGLYLINFLLCGFLWRVCYRGRVVEGLQEGAECLIRFPMLLFRRSDARGLSWMAALVLGIIAVGSLYLPGLVYWAAVYAQLNYQLFDTTASVDPVLVWRQEPQISIESKSGGAFGDYDKGDPAAPVQIVEFADFECPGCRRLYAGLHELLERHSGGYHLIFRNYPLDNECNPNIKQEFHKNACLAAFFTRCAGEQGRFWEAFDLVFTDPIISGDSASAVVREFFLTKGAESLSLDKVALEECLSSNRYMEKIQSDIKAGDDIGLEATPSVWINGKRVPYPSVDAIEKIIQALRQEKASRP